MIDDLSSEQPMEPESFDRGNPARRCTAHRKNGDRCRKWAIRGGNVCTHHGGRARQTVEKARRRLAENADRGAKQLLALAFDDKQSADIRLKATLQLLDRAGVNSKTAVEVEVVARPWERIFDSITDGVQAGSRAEYRAQLGSFHPPALADSDAADMPMPAGGSIVDAEVVVDEPEWAGPDVDAEFDPAIAFGGPLGPFDAPRGDMMSIEDAVAAQAEMNRRTAHQRALPPGAMR